LAALGVEAVKKFADTGEKPKPTEGKNFVDTGVTLVTDKPVKGLDSIDTKEGLNKCWG
jgi:fructose transport system substrate-binding protein